MSAAAFEKQNNRPLENLMQKMKQLFPRCNTMESIKGNIIVITIWLSIDNIYIFIITYIVI